MQSLVSLLKYLATLPEEKPEGLYKTYTVTDLTMSASGHFSLTLIQNAKSQWRCDGSGHRFL